MRFATVLQSALTKATPLKDRGIKEANFAVLRLANMPAVLVECGFISSGKGIERMAISASYAL